MSRHERAVYRHEQLLDFYCMEEDKGTPIYQLEQTDVNLYFELKSHRKKRKDESNAPPDEQQPNTTIDALFGFH